MYLIDKLNAICATLGGATTHKYSINALNEWCILAGGVGGHVYDIAAYNELAVIYGASGGHKYNIKALNAIAASFGATETYLYDYQALAFIGSNVNQKDDDFIITINTTKPGSASNTFVFPLTAKTANDVVIKWGDGSEDSYSITGNKTHVYASPGIYQVRVNKEMTAFSFNNQGDNLKPIFHDNWGSAEFTNMIGAFFGCTNIQYRASDFPNTSQVASMASMFNNTPFNQSVANFDTSKVTRMDYMFSGSSFNQSVANFDTSEVKNMAYMFRNTPFNQSVTNFNTSKVTNMAYMFFGTPFNQSVANFDTSEVKNMDRMFYNTPFNQSVANFDTSKVTTMSAMFYNTPFNQSVANFDTSEVKNMAYMFCNTPIKHSINFNIPLVTDLRSMFEFCDVNEAGTTANYDLTLNNFANNPNTPNNLTFHGGNSKYSAIGKVGRDILISKGWTITDGGLAV